MAFERKSLGGIVSETKQIQVNGIDVGVIAGYIASWQPDAWNGMYGIKDRILKGAYTKSLQEHVARKNRQVRFKDHHGRTVGGFPIETMKEDNVGLYGVGHVNLETQQGREAYSLARQKVLVDFSVGHVVIDDRIEGEERIIAEAKVLEGSIVDEPLNQRSNVTEVKSVQFGDLPIVSGSHDWDEEEAKKRVMELKFSEGNGAHAFIGDELIADVVNGKLMIIPEAVQKAAQKFIGSDQKEAQVALEKYFGKMGVTSPFEEKVFFTVDDIQEWGAAELKEALSSTGSFSNGAVRALVANMRNERVVPSYDEKGAMELLKAIRETQNTLKGN